MKTIFITISILIGFTCGTFAQEEHPATVPAQEGKVLYLYNRNMRGFLVGGNNYNTQASLSFEHAFKVILEKYLDTNGRWDGSTYFITDSVELGDFRGGYRKLFIENNGLLYVDQDDWHTPNRDNLWTVKAIAGKENIYLISPSSYNKKHDFRGKQLGVMALSAQSLPVVGIYDPISNEIDYEWCFVTEESKNLFLEKQQAQKASKRNSIIVNNLKKAPVPDEQIVYLYNIDFDGFLVGGNQYNTMASLSKTDAQKVILHKYVNGNNAWDGKSYLITDSVTNGSYAGRYRNVYIAPNGMIWTDQREENSHLDCVWEIEPSESNSSVCYIRPSEMNLVFKPESLPDYYLSAVVHENFRELPTLALVKGKESKYCTWAIVTEELWEQLELVNRREELQKYINIVLNRYPSADIITAQQVCNDEKSASSEVENQIGQMRLVLFSNGNTSKNSVDFTNLIKNADFEGTGGLGWNMPFDVKVGSITWFGGDSLNHCAEAWQALFEFYQDVRGIPNGLYRVDLQAFNRTRGADLAWIERDSSLVTPEFYANSMSLPIKNLMQTTFPSDDDAFDFLQAEMSSYYNPPKWQCIDGTFALHNMRATALAFAKGHFNQSLYCYVDNGKIRIGIREQQKRTGSWTAWDNFRLVYLAETVEIYKEAVHTHLEQAKSTERLAKLKGIECDVLYETIAKAEQTLQSYNVERMRESLSLLNLVIKETRKSLVKKEFFEELVTSKDQEEENEEKKLIRNKRNSERDSIRRVIDKAHSFCYIGNVVLGYNVELALIRFNKAFDLLMNVPETYHTNVDSCANIMSLIYQEKERYEDAINVWEKLAESRSKSRWESSKCYYEIGNILNFRKKEYLKAEGSYRNAISIIEKLYDEASEYDYEYGINKYKKILASYLNEFSYCLAYQKKYDEALVSIERSIELQPENANYYDSKGEFLYISGDKEGAKAMWKKVIELDADFAKGNDSQLYKYLYGK